MKLIKKGAEADIYETSDGILKKRVKKNYRVDSLDDRIRKIRTRAEANILQKSRQIGANVPKVVKINENDQEITIEKIEGPLVKDFLSAGNYHQIAQKIAQQIALLHSNDIIHGDLTTSNMILDPKGNLVLIDFGLAKHSSKAEDKAVDLHLLEETLESTHTEISEKMFAIVLKEYQKLNKNSKEVIDRYNKLKERGRYKKHE